MVSALPSCRPAAVCNVSSNTQTHYCGNNQNISSRLHCTKTARTLGDATPQKNKKQEMDLKQDALTQEFSRVALLIKILESAEEGGVSRALEGWNQVLSARNIVSVINNITNWHKALDFFGWVMAREDVYELNVYTFNVMLKVLRNSQQWTISKQIFEEMRNRRIQPDNHTYSTMISCAKICNQPEESLKLFQSMKNSGIVPDQVTYNSMVDVYAKSGLAHEAIELYEKLKSMNSKVDRVTFGAMTSMYARTGDYMAIMRLLQDMKLIGVQPSPMIMNTMIGALSKGGKTHQARKIFEEMYSLGVEPTPATSSIMIDMYTKIRDYDQVFIWYKKMKRNGWKCDVMVYTSLLKGCIQNGRVKDLEKIMQDMEEMKIPANQATYRAAMSTYASKGYVENARSMFRMVAETGYCDTAAYSVMMRAYKMAGDITSVCKVFDEMIENGNEPDDRVSGLLLSCLIPSNTEEQKQCILSCMQRTNESLHIVLRSLLTNDVTSLGALMDNIRKALLAYPSTLMRKAVCNMLIEFCWISDMKRIAQEIFRFGIALEIYDGLQTNLPTLWRLNLRTLSFSAAHCAMEDWFSMLKLAIDNGEQLPQDLIIETGVATARNGKKGVNTFVGSWLKNVEAPFFENNDPAGYYYASGPILQQWIEDTFFPLPL